jgi:hypothetical protein
MDRTNILIKVILILSIGIGLFRWNNLRCPSKNPCDTPSGESEARQCCLRKFGNTFSGKTERDGFACVLQDGSVVDNSIYFGDCEFGYWNGCICVRGLKDTIHYHKFYYGHIVWWKLVAWCIIGS